MFRHNVLEHIVFKYMLYNSPDLRVTCTSSCIQIYDINGRRDIGDTFPEMPARNGLIILGETNCQIIFFVLRLII